LKNENDDVLYQSRSDFLADSGERAFVLKHHPYASSFGFRECCFSTTLFPC